VASIFRNGEILSALWRVKPLSKNLRIRFGTNLAHLRARTGFSQETLAEKLDIHPSHVQKLEYGSVSPSFGILVRLKRSLNCAWEELLDGIE
jgi:transcriptional regulator with XRE-family HTH domain